LPDVCYFFFLFYVKKKKKEKIWTGDNVLTKLIPGKKKQNKCNILENVAFLNLQLITAK